MGSMHVGAFLGVGNVLDVETVSDIGIAEVLKVISVTGICSIVEPQSGL